MLEKLQAVENRYEELCAKSEQPDFYADPKKAAAILREQNDLEPIIKAFREYRRARQDMIDAESLMSDHSMFFYDNVDTGYFCPCSEERMERALIAIGKKDLQEIIETDGHAELKCHFCRRSFDFDKEKLLDILEKAKG